MALSNRQIIEKADLAIRDLQEGGGYLLPAQAHKFLRLLIQSSELLPQATVVPMAAPRQQTPKIKFGGRVLRAGKEGNRLAETDRARPDLSYTELDARLFRAEIELSDEDLEDSVERDDFQQTVMELLAEAVGRDMEEVAVKGDRNSSDPFLAQLDGILAQTVSHVVDAGGDKLSKDLLFDAVRALPNQYLRIKKSLAFLCSTDTDLSYRNTLAERATIGGDKWLETDVPVLYSGIPLRPIPLFPSDQEAPPNPPDPANPPGLVVPAPHNRTSVVLANPKNLQVGIWRKVKIEQWRDISAGVLRIVASLRFDVRWADELGTVKIANLVAA